MTNYEDEQNYQVYPDLADSGIKVQEKPVNMSMATEYESEPVQEPIQEKVLEQPREDHPNFRSLREKAERERDRADRERERAERLEYELRQAYQPRQQVQEEREEYLGDDDIFTGKHANKLEKKTKHEIQQLKQELENTRQQMADELLRTRHPDISKVLTSENVRLLNEQEPELAQALNKITDYRAKVEATYRLIKKMEVPVENNYEKDKSRVQSNASKPRNVNSISPQQGESPLSRANAFANNDDSPEAQMKRYEQMMKYASNRE